MKIVPTVGVKAAPNVTGAETSMTPSKGNVAAMDAAAYNCWACALVNEWDGVIALKMQVNTPRHRWETARR